ncbi:GNAT family N-acetyltransferase [Mediterraneibacter gnavus]|uniref:GNAT family N-acetyltransferase n=1 Tax=Mediterraneibacter gnavus TaxID=33038 RepID=UPI0036D32EE9
MAENIFINKPYSYYYVMKYLNPEFDAWKPILDKNGRIISFEIGCFSEPCIFGVSFWSKSDAEIFKKIIADISTPENLSNSENFWDDYFNDFLDEIQIHTLEIPNYVASEMNNIIEYDMAITMCQKYYSNPKQYFINWHNNKNEYSYIMNTSQALSYTQKLLEEYIYKHPDENFSLTKPSYFENNEYPYIIQKEKKSIGFIDIAIEKNFFLLRRIYLDKSYRRQRLGTQILENIITFSKLTNKELRVNVYDEEAEKFYKRLGFRKNFTNYVIRRQ